MKYKVTLNGRTYEVEVEAGKAMLTDEYEAFAPAPAAARGLLPPCSKLTKSYSQQIKGPELTAAQKQTIPRNPPAQPNPAQSARQGGRASAYYDRRASRCKRLP